jgi:hypothetical protein
LAAEWEAVAQLQVEMPSLGMVTVAKELMVAINGNGTVNDNGNTMELRQ